MILAIKTDMPEAELYLCDAKGTILATRQWTAHRELSDTIFVKINELFEEAESSLSDITVVAVFKGPGSFTGLRIGVAVANALAYALQIPVIGCTGIDWIQQCVIPASHQFFPVEPLYGQAPHITRAKK